MIPTIRPNVAYYNHNTAALSPAASLAEAVRVYLAAVPWKPLLQRVPGLLNIALILFCLYAPANAPWAFAFYYSVLHAVFFANVSRTVYGTYVAYTHSKAHSMTDWHARYCREIGAADGSDTAHDLPFDQIMHIVIIPNYKETMDTLCETLDVLASHRRAITQYRVCLAMEESEKGASEKALELLQAYGDSFFEITYTVHPAGRPGEIRGKSSNVAWAATQMAMRGGARHDHEILTVMDADTGFAEDYFTALSYHYAVASPEQRRIMMFAPSTVFDRNAKSVPSFVRVTDMYWSIGVISNLYPTSPVKIPCSAYSVSMDLAISVGFWDAGAEAIGEDMHMYLKCFFSTNGHVIVKTIFSPASQCNIEGEGEGLAGYISGMSARYTQGKRHLWGTLDFGYSIRRTILSYIAPETQRTVQLKNAGVSKFGKEDASASTINPKLLLVLAHRLLECHLLMGQFLVLVALGSLVVPDTNSFLHPVSSLIWSVVSPVASVHPAVKFIITAGFWFRLACVLPSAATFYFYEKYHQWVGFDRWNLQDRSEGIAGRRVDSGSDLSYIPAGVLPGYDQPKVQHLGLRPQLSSPRIYPWAVLDWIATPFSGVFFFIAPQFVAQFSHLFTDQLDYKVAAKPILNRLPAGSAPAVPSTPPPPYSERVSEPMPLSIVSSTIPAAASKLQHIHQHAHHHSNSSNSSNSSSAQALLAKHHQLGSHAFVNMHQLTPAHLKLAAKLDELEVKSNSSSRGDEGYFDETDDAASAASLSFATGMSHTPPLRASLSTSSFSSATVAVPV
ncbi:hypothetical protein BC831DRAFT_456278 [Entophlyctis helioformis]|nr:hypothetical protein BC831DRAFT_456278 [Entophlyctis helioformis]